jgi:hypothetical protein
VRRIGIPELAPLLERLDRLARSVPAEPER